VERDDIRRALERAGGNKKAAAQILGSSRRALDRRLERLDLGRTISRRPVRAAWPGPAGADHQRLTANREHHRVAKAGSSPPQAVFCRLFAVTRCHPLTSR
jgi:hypothetical protein